MIWRIIQETLNQTDVEYYSPGEKGYSYFYLKKIMKSAMVSTMNSGINNSPVGVYKQGQNNNIFTW